LDLFKSNPHYYNKVSTLLLKNKRSVEVMFILY